VRHIVRTLTGLGERERGSNAVHQRPAHTTAVRTCEGPIDAQAVSRFDSGCPREFLDDGQPVIEEICARAPTVSRADVRARFVLETRGDPGAQPVKTSRGYDAVAGAAVGRYRRRYPLLLSGATSCTGRENSGAAPIVHCKVTPARAPRQCPTGGSVTQGSSANLVVHKLRILIRQKATQAASGSPDHSRLQKMLELSDDALLDTIYNSVDANPDRVGCPPRDALRELATRTRPLSDPWWDHVMACAPCRIDVREMGRVERLHHCRRRRVRSLWRQVRSFCSRSVLGRGC
jgi:hypothetical protein